MEGSPSPYEDVRLPQSVELCIKRIRDVKQQPPLKNYTRQMLFLIGEEASIGILNNILSSNQPISSFSGFVRHLVKKDHPNEAAAVLSAYDSPQSSRQTQRMGSLSSASPYISPLKLNDESLQSPLTSSPVNCSSNLQRTSSHNIRCRLSFEDETQKKMNHSARNESSRAEEPGQTAEATTISTQLMILNKLEFRKLFLVLSYIGRQTLEAAVTLDGASEVCNMSELPMTVFESEMWNKYGQKFCDESDRSQYLYWDSGKTHFYYCHVCRDGSYYFKGPYLNSSRTHLQRSLGDDNILIVKFEDGACATGQIAEEGIIVGLRRYRFFVFKDERKKAKKKQTEKDKKAIYSGVKCFFVHIDSISPHGCDDNYILSRKSISEARRMFMHLHTLPTIEKYMARFSLILSRTTKLEVDFTDVKVKIIDDIPFRDEKDNIIRDEDGKPILHTDGTGYISEDLAMKCARDFHAAKYIGDSIFETSDWFANFEDTGCLERGTGARNRELPLLVQCRLFHDGDAAKGTLLVNRKLEPGRIQIRESMIKVEKESPTLQMNKTFNSLEIVAISQRPGKNYLSKYLIALLSYGGVPQKFFLNLLTDALEETRNMYKKKRAALRVSSNHDGLDFGFIVQRMICSGAPLDEPYLQHCLSNLESGEKTKLKEGRIRISESFYLMGTADPTGVLNNDEVSVILDSGQISGKVLVYRYPGMHFGDIHIMEAVYVEKLEEVVGNAKYGIFFSTKGQRSAAYEMATGDFDGDKYWVSRNPELLKYFKANEPWRRVYSAPNSKKINPREFSDLELERELFRLLQGAMRPSPSMGIAADSWLSFMDRLLTLGDDRADEKSSLKEKMIQLVDIYYDALDAPKSGKKVEVPDELRANMYPHHMEKGPDISYRSSSILGQIYDRVQAFKNEAVRKQEIWKLPCIDDPIPEMYDMWKARHENYCREMARALKSGGESKNDAANDVIKKYKQMLYGAPDMEESAKDTEVIYEEAIAIYHVAYDYAMSNGVEKCGFAWRVAGSALFNYCAWKHAGPREKPLTILPSILRGLY